MFPIHRMAGHNQASMLMDVHISAVNLIVSTLAFLFSPWNFFLQPLPSQPKGWEENVKKQTKKKKPRLDPVLTHIPYIMCPPIC